MLDQYCTDNAIVRKLSNLRAKYAAKERERLRLDAISPGHRDQRMTNHALALQLLLPPRQDWKRPRLREGMTGQQKTAESVLAGAMIALNSADDASSYQTFNLRAFVAEVRDRMLENRPYVFDRPEITPVPKAKDSLVYRAIAQLNRVDSVVDKITATYLQGCFDADLLVSALAFRAGKPGQPPPNHHDGVRAILEFLDAHSGGELWVGEYDIKKFFDCIGHDVAKAAVDRAVAGAERRGVVVDPRAIQIIKAFIDCYSFPKDVLQGALPALKLRNADATFDWPGEHGSLDAFYTNPMDAKIGIVQGAALSNLIANLVLHYADVEVTTLRGRGEVLYERYCDDMFLICTSRADCQRRMKAYGQAMTRLYLPVHEPQPLVPYGKSFWKQKSKGPYRWTNQPGGVPWVSFCGYQVHFDGHLRIRPSSVRKQIDAMREETDQVVRRILSAGKDQIKLSGQQILRRFERRLTCRLVGHRTPTSQPGDLSPNCVASGFQLLAEYPHQQGQLRVFDRVRGECVRELDKALRRVGAPESPKKPSRHLRQNKIKFYGKPFSMAGQYPSVVSNRPAPRLDKQSKKRISRTVTCRGIIAIAIGLAILLLTGI
jgi:hypothetical protein